MATIPMSPTQRGAHARSAVEQLGGAARDQVRLQVHCAQSHHLARVIDTPEGLVYAATVHGHGHGSRDRVDVGHHGDRRPHPWYDLLDVSGMSADDGLPAWCDCGSRSLSRAAVLGWVRAGERRVVVD